jgi:Cu/Ag efflux pump CusA
VEVELRSHYEATQDFVRGHGYIKGPADIEDIVLKVQNGTPVSVKNIARVHLGGNLRRSLAELDGKVEVVGGIVIMGYGENALNVISGVKKKLQQTSVLFARGGPDHSDLRSQRNHQENRDPDPGERTELLIGAAKAVGRPLFFSLLVITVSFIPVFSLTAQEGRLFRPLASPRRSRCSSRLFSASHLFLCSWCG